MTGRTRDMLGGCWINALAVLGSLAPHQLRSFVQSCSLCVLGLCVSRFALRLYTCSCRARAAVPQPSKLDFVINPGSRIDPLDGPRAGGLQPGAKSAKPKVGAACLLLSLLLPRWRSMLWLPRAMCAATGSVGPACAHTQQLHAVHARLQDSAPPVAQTCCQQHPPVQWQ